MMDIFFVVHMHAFPGVSIALFWTKINSSDAC